MVTAKDLVGEYRLQRSSGVDAGARNIILELRGGDAPETLHMHAKVANTLSADWTLSDGILQGRGISTLMMGPDYEMQVERILGAGMNAGIKVRLRDAELTLTDAAGEQLVFRRV